MAYRIRYSWGEKDILPSVATADTALDAHRAVQRLKGAGMKILAIESTGAKGDGRISQNRLTDIARAERGLRPEARHRRTSTARKA